MPERRTFVLTDTAHDLWTEDFSIDGDAAAGCVVSKRRLRGGRRDGVDLIRVDNGALTFQVVPTRGMGLWKAALGGDRVGWDSPTHDGPVHPAYVQPHDLGGIGWLEGFDELMVRCGLMSNGAPFRDGEALHPLHGRIASIPAWYVAVHVEGDSVAIEGRVRESFLFGGGVELRTTYATTRGSNAVTVRDEFVNVKDVPTAMEILYHWNFGPPHLGEGSRFVAPLKELVPRDARAAEGLATYDVYGPPEPGFAEQAYFCSLRDESGRTAAMLRDKAGERAVALRYDVTAMPCFTLWKCTGGLRDGYVTGLEPGVNFPNPRPFEEAQGRVVTLPVDGRHVIETTLEVLSGRDSVAALESEIARIQSQGNPVVRPKPTAPFAREG
ncbi:aldose 1-epimerase family protein [Paludisphaera sp.]|uniref:aldose 1-epimerase family protein n=1 Tax=Paludisphaera sp. TaxID=2017432 RepID=UPI00301DE2B2